MTVGQSAAVRPADPAHERIQREHELNAALTAARVLQGRLEMLGDREADVRIVRSLRDSLSRDLEAVGG
jgi:hypothetical protein